MYIIHSSRGGIINIKNENGELIDFIAKDKGFLSSVQQVADYMGCSPDEIVSQNRLNKGISYPTWVSQGVVKSVEKTEFENQLRNFCTELDNKLADNNYEYRKQRFALVDKYDMTIANFTESIKNLVTSKRGQPADICEAIDEQIKELQSERKERQNNVYKLSEFKRGQKQLERELQNRNDEVCKEAKQKFPGYVVDKIHYQRTPSWKQIGGKKQYVIPYRRSDSKLIWGSRFQKQGKSEKPTWADILAGKRKSFKIEKLPKQCESERADRDSLYRFCITIKGNAISGIVRLWNPPSMEDKITSFEFNGNKLLVTVQKVSHKICEGRLKASLDLGWRKEEDGCLRVATCLIEDGTLVRLYIPQAYIKDDEILRDKLSVRKKWSGEKNEDYKHLCKTINGLRSKMQRCLDSCYKQFVAALQRNCDIPEPGLFGNTWYGGVGTIVADSISLADLATKGKGQIHNANRQLAAISKLKDAIEKSKMEKKSVDLKESKPSQKCTACGFLHKTSDLIIKCKCGHVEDRDLRSCINTYEAVFGEKAPPVVSEINLTPNYHGYNCRKMLAANNLA